MTPADEATKVNVQTNIQITFSKGLDSSSINRSTASLRRKSSFGVYTVSTTVAYDDASQTITINPSGGLVNDGKFIITLSGIRDKAGNTMAMTTFSFNTYKNPTTRHTYYNGGSISYYYSYTYDASGNQTRYVVYIGAGADGVWFTGDDVVSIYNSYTYDANNNRIDNTYYNNPGADSTWFTGDDVVGWRYNYDISF